MYTNLEFSLNSTLAVILLIFQRFSFRFRRLIGRSVDAPSYTEGVDLTGKITVITGANAGIGRETAVKLVSCGATVVLGCRDIQKGIEAAQQINNEISSLNPTIHPYAKNGKAIFMRLDLSDLSSVVEFSNKIKSDYPRVDILINNAGVNMTGMLSTGLEQLFQVNYLGHYLLIRCLQKHLCYYTDKDETNCPNVARIINLSSVMHHGGQPNFVASSTHSYTTLMAAKSSYYADSKLYMHFLTMEVNRRFDISKSYSLTQSPNSYSSFDNEKGLGSQAHSIRPIISLSVNPGAVRSDIWRDYPFQTIYNMIMKLIFLEVDEGCASSVYAATVETSIIRDYQQNLIATKDIGGRFIKRPDVPYIVPYQVSSCSSCTGSTSSNSCSTGGGCLAQEMLGVYEGCIFSGVSLPTHDEVIRSGLQDTSYGVTSSSTGTTMHPIIQAKQLWKYSGDLCYKILLKLGLPESEIKFLLE